MRFGPKVVLCLVCCVSAGKLTAQPDRIPGAIDGSRVVDAPGVVHPLIRAGIDEGPAEASLPLDHMQLVAAPSPAQQAELDRLLAAQQDPASPQFRKWLTPEQYADRFGLSRSDLSKISAWLQAAGFQIKYTARARNWITFSGTAGQVEGAMHTTVHRYLVRGEQHWAIAADPQLPEGIAPLVGTLLGLNDFDPKPAGGAVMPSPADSSDVKNVGHTLAPGDLATIYDLNPLYQTGIDGTGESIVVVGETDPAAALSDTQTFRSKYGLSATTIQTVLGGSDPGVSTNSAVAQEAALDLEAAGAIARNAKLIYVYATSADVAAMYAIDQDLAPIVSESFGSCETGLPSSYAASVRLTAQQGNTEGISWLASSGDSGSAGCDPKGRTLASEGLAVLFPSSIPEVTAVGGTEFNDGGGNYWAATNGPNGGSALSYIPEVAWNDSVYGTGLATVFATGGGVSTLFAKPAWQKGPGVPNDGQRDVPDVALAGSLEHDQYDIVAYGVAGFSGGTSAATPVMAGILALLNEYTRSNGLGNVNALLYPLSQTLPSAFHDITGGSNVVPCSAGSPACVSGKMGFNAGPGYDLTTGLGSVDAFNLVTGWNGAPANGVTLSSLSPPSAAAGGAAFTLTATGKNFSSSASIKWNGTALATTFVSSTQLTATVLASQIAAASTAAVTVLSGAAISGPLYFTINAPTVAFGQPQISTAGASTCPGPPAATFFSTNMTAYLIFTMTVTAADQINVEWLAPDGTPYPSANNWYGNTGTYCYSSDGLSLANVPPSQFGNWTGRVYVNGSLLFSVPFTVSCGMAGLPSISAVDSASSYGGYSYFAPGSWLEIKGTNLADPADPRLTALVNPGQWTSSDFSGVNAPTSLDGVSVRIDGKAAFPSYLSTNQINVQAPQDSATGTVSVSVTTCKGTSAAFNFKEQALAPGMLAPPQFLIGGKQYTVGTFYSDNAYVLSTSDGMALGVASRPAQGGDLIVLYGIGFGSLSPSTAPGVVAKQATALADPVTVSFGTATAKVSYQGLYPGFVGLYEFYVTVPSGLAAGDYPITITQNGTALPQMLYLTVAN